METLVKAQSTEGQKGNRLKGKLSGGGEMGRCILGKENVYFALQMKGKRGESCCRVVS
jgi:chemotaxis receptor (MCP) glutamine deamidase CheD